ncbi:MAG: HAD-IC family P-type ATPase, partial [bacterium]
AASLEKSSQHPVAEAIVHYARNKGIAFPEAKQFDTIEGRGVKGMLDGKPILVGNPAFMEVNNIDYPTEAQSEVSRIEKEGKSVTLIAYDRKILGLIGVADTIKATSERAISELKRMGLELIMLTGDNEYTAKAIAAKLGIEKVRAGVLPQDKAQEVKGIQEGGRVVSFVGDGINDAPALAQADVGIAIGGGTDIAIESGDIILMQGDMIDAAAAVQLGRKVMSRIKQNLFWAFAYNTALIPVAAGLLYPFFRITFRPELAGFAMAMSSVTVVTLSLLLKRYVPAAKRMTGRKGEKR